jgi:hypothetical protein
MPTLDDDIGRMTKGLRDNAKDIFDIWMFQPARHAEFGSQEIEDIEETIIGLNAVIRFHNRKKLKVVSNG